MPSLQAWKNRKPIDPATRAVDAWERITHKPSEITLYRGEAPLAAQTVRIEFDGGSGNSPQGTTGRGTQRTATIFGVRNHPEIADTDIKAGDIFRHDGANYHVVAVIKTIGEVQAVTEVNI